MMHEQACCHDEAVNHQSLIVLAFWNIWMVSMEECSSLMQNLLQIHCSTRSVILNARATQYTCSLNSIYRPHWLVQWSHHCSCMHIPVHSPWLPGYIDVAQTILIILTIAVLFPDRPCIYQNKTFTLPGPRKGHRAFLRGILHVLPWYTPHPWTRHDNYKRTKVWYRGWLGTVIMHGVVVSKAVSSQEASGFSINA